MIVGAGPAGSSAAFFLARQGLDVLLLEKKKMPRTKPCGDGIGPRTVLKLTEMGLADWMEQSGFYRIDRMRLISESGRSIVSDTSGYDFPTPFGYVVRREIFDKRLVENAQAAGADFVDGFQVKNCLFERDRAIGVTGNHNGKKVTVFAGLIVLADGSTGLLSRAFAKGIKEERAIAYRGYARFDNHLDRNVNIYFSSALPRGYGWIFPLSESSANVGIGSLGIKTEKADLKKAFRQFVKKTKVPVALSEASFDDNYRGSIMRMSFGRLPLRLSGIAFIGDAAGMVSPINGEGISHAMESAHLLSEVIENNFNSYNSIDKALMQYEKSARKKYSSYFRWAGMLSRLLSNHRRLNKLMIKAEKDETLAHALTGVLSNTIPPRELARPGMLRRMLF